jgi:predicted transcriptional regulator
MSTENRSLQALVTQVQSTTDYAVLGGRLQASGMGEDEISSLLGLVERTIRDNVREASEKAATDTVMSVLSVFLELMARAHEAASLQILRDLKARTHGFGGARVHAGCVEAALNVLNAGPRHLSATRIVADYTQH